MRVLLRNQVQEIEHIGSTADPGLIGKAIIDILATVSDFERAFESIPKIERIGYEYRGEKQGTPTVPFHQGYTRKVLSICATSIHRHPRVDSISRLSHSGS